MTFGLKKLVRNWDRKNVGSQIRSIWTDVKLRQQECLARQLKSKAPMCQPWLGGRTCLKKWRECAHLQHRDGNEGREDADHFKFHGCRSKGFPRQRYIDTYDFGVELFWSSSHAGTRTVRNCQFLAALPRTVLARKARWPWLRCVRRRLEEDGQLATKRSGNTSGILLRRKRTPSLQEALVKEVETHWRRSPALFRFIQLYFDKRSTLRLFVCVNIRLGLWQMSGGRMTTFCEKLEARNQALRVSCGNLISIVAAVCALLAPLHVRPLRSMVLEIQGSDAGFDKGKGDLRNIVGSRDLTISQ